MTVERVPASALRAGDMIVAHGGQHVPVLNVETNEMSGRRTVKVRVWTPRRPIDCLSTTMFLRQTKD